MIEIEVDELPVPVDEDEFTQDPDAVVEQVRRAREEMRLTDVEPAEDYDTLTARWDA